MSSNSTQPILSTSDLDQCEKPARAETPAAQISEPNDLFSTAPPHPITPVDAPGPQVEFDHVLKGLKIARERPVPAWSSYQWGLQYLIRAVKDIELTRDSSVHDCRLIDMTRQQTARIESEVEIIRRCIMIPAMRNNFVRDLESCAFRLQRLLT